MNNSLYGIDVAVRRADDIDKKMVAFVQESAKNPCITVLDLGCGAGGQSVRMANTGACVTGIDVGGYTEAFKVLRESNGLTQQQLNFIQGDVEDLDTVLSGREFHMCCFQRTLHYLPYAQALEVLVWLRGHVSKKLFISVTGVESDIGRNYADKNKPVGERYCSLHKEDSEAFSLDEPVCLYTPEEFIVLLQDSGWKVDECWVSAFGNIKAVCI